VRPPRSKIAGEISRRLEHALPRAGKRERRAQKLARARRLPVVEIVSPDAGAQATLTYAIDEIEQLLDRWTERDPSTLAGAYYLQLLHLSEQLSLLLKD
tara:strand:- start:391 stop:687 length:297 start_codon:yes stop_codon:yes gene_type:complete